MKTRTLRNSLIGAFLASLFTVSLDLVYFSARVYQGFRLDWSTIIFILALMTTRAVVAEAILMLKGGFRILDFLVSFLFFGPPVLTLIQIISENNVIKIIPFLLQFSFPLGVIIDILYLATLLDFWRLLILVIVKK